MAADLNDVDTTLVQIRDVLILLGLAVCENGDEKTKAKEKLWELAKEHGLISN